MRTWSAGAWIAFLEVVTPATPKPSQDPAENLGWMVEDVTAVTTWGW